MTGFWKFLGMATMLSVVWTAAADDAVSLASPEETGAFLQKMQQAAQPGGKTLKIESGILEYSGTMMKVAIVSTVKFKSPDKLCSITDVGGMQKITTLYNGVKGWRIDKLSTAELTGNPLEFLAFQAKMSNPTLPLTEIFQSITLTAGTEQLDGRACRRLWGRLPEKFGLPPVELLADDETFLLRQIKMVAPTPLGNLPNITNYGDYRNVDGVMLPMKQTSQAMGMTIELRITSAKFNVPLADSDFEPVK